MDALFDMDAGDWGPTRFIRCGYCTASISATVNSARTNGWRVFDGVSGAGQPLRDAICPRCYLRQADQPDRKDEVETPPLVDTASYDSDGRAGSGQLGT